MSKDLEVSAKFTKSGREIMPEGMSLHKTKKRWVTGGESVVVGKVNLGLAISGTTFAIISNSISNQSGGVDSPAMVTMLALSIASFSVLTVGVIIVAVEGAIPTKKRLLEENTPAFNDKSSVSHFGSYKGDNKRSFDIYEGDGVRWTELKKPSLRAIFNPRRLFSNVILSKYVSHNLKSDTYKVHTFSGNWFKTTHQVDNFLGDRAVFMSAVKKRKGVSA